MSASASEHRLQQGLDFQRQGRLAEAEAIYRKMLAGDPHNAAALHLLGVLVLQQNRSDEGISLIRQALAIQPALVSAHDNLGRALEMTGELEAAADSFSRALALVPTYRQANLSRARIRERQGRMEDALKDLDRAMGLSWDVATALRRIEILLKLDRAQDALAGCAVVLTRDPRHGETLIRRGIALESLGRLDDALASYERALTCDPTNSAAYLNSARLLATKLRRPQEAMTIYDRLIALTPGDAIAYGARGLFHRQLSQFEEALADYERASALMPASAELRNDRGLTWMDIGKLDEALSDFDRAIALNPDFDGGFVNKGQLLLLLGQYAQGWRYSERRKLPPMPTASRWQGEHLSGKTLFIKWERGFGDVLQFCRFAAQIQTMGATILLSVPARLVRLMRSLTPTVTLVADGTIPDKFDFYIPLMSLPLVLDTVECTIPSAVPYLNAEPALVTRWRERIGTQGIRIGICWQGNPDFGHPPRSFALPTLKPVADHAGVRLISLQKDLDPMRAGLPPGMKVETLGADFDAGPDAFVDTAAAMESLDLVISCDTSIAHLAGALGRPIWLALKHVPYCLWQMERSDTPWYPTMRLFRQPAPGDWLGVFAAMAEELNAAHR